IAASGLATRKTTTSPSRTHPSARSQPRRRGLASTPIRRASAVTQRLSVRVTLTIITSGRTAPNYAPGFMSRAALRGGFLAPTGEFSLAGHEAGGTPSRYRQHNGQAIPLVQRLSATHRMSGQCMSGEGSVEPTGSHPALPQLRLDDLLSELQARLQTVLATRDRGYTLLDAVVAVGTNLDLETVLKQIVEAAITLVRARYGALGIIGEGGRLAEFVPVGLASDEIKAIHHWPEGRGLLGALITDPRPLRLPDISGSPKSSGFPPGHPPMGSFLGVPVRVRDEVYGNLYLTEKEGGAEFDEEDEALLVALAAAAGVAIDNAKLYEEGRRQQRWLRASSEVTRRLLSGDPPDEVLALVTQQALEMSGADLVALALPTQDRQQLVISHAAGAGAPEAIGLVLPVSASVSGQVLTSGEAVVLEDFGHDERVAGAAREHMPLGPAIILPLGAPGDVRGVFTVGRDTGAMPLAHDGADKD